MRTVKDLSQIGGVWQDSFVPPPELPQISLLTADEAVAEKIREGAGKVREWVVSTLFQIDAIGSASRELQELNEEQVNEARSAINGFLGHETKAYRRAAWLGTFKQRLAATANSKTEAQAVIDGLVQDRLLEKTDEGPLKIFDETYTVPAISTFKEPELEEVIGFLRQFTYRTLQAERQARTKHAEELYGQSELSLEDFLAGKAGRITLGTPPEPMVNQDGSPVLKPDGAPQWRGGGTLLVESDGANKIFPVAASGNIQRGVEEAIALKVHVLLHTLDWEFLGGIQGLDEARFKKLVLIWNLLKRGIAAEKRNIAIRSQKAELTEGVEIISMKEFFVEGRPGSCLVNLNKPWEPQVANGEGSVYIHDFFFMVKRSMQESEDGPRVFIHVTKAPGHITDYLAKCMDVYPEGEKFGGCPQPLQAILRATFGQVTKEESLAEKFGQK